MKHTLFVILVIALSCTVAFAQYADRSKDDISLQIGLLATGDDRAFNATYMQPFNINDGAFSGWFGAFHQQIQYGDEIRSKIRNYHLEAGVRLIKGLDVRVFADQEQDYIKGYDQKAQFGLFPERTLNSHVRIAAGNFFEQEAIREDLGLTDSDPQLVRYLGIVYVQWSKLALKWVITPEVRLNDFQASVEPTVEFNINDRSTVTLKSVVDFDTDPASGDRVTANHSVNLGVKF